MKLVSRFRHYSWQWLKGRNGSKHHCNDLLPYQRVFEQLHSYHQKNLGVQNVPVEAVIGSFGRTRDFDLSFKPLNRRTLEHVNEVAAVDPRRRPMPIVTYKVGDAYFVEDGNHRISLARSRGQDTVKAVVVEVDTSTLVRKASCERLRFELDKQGCEQ